MLMSLGQEANEGVSRRAQVANATHRGQRRDVEQNTGRTNKAHEVIILCLA
jgi:hypothetical protein